MKIFGTALGTVFGLALLLALLAGGYFLFEYVVSVFAALEPQARTLVAIGSVVVLLSAVIIAEGLKARGQNGRQAAAEKTATYERLLSFCCERLKRPENPEVRAADEELVKIERLLVLQGSTKVITAYVKLKRLAKQGGTPSETELALLNALVMEMRSDLGRPEFIRKQNDLLELLTERSPTVS